MTNVATHLITYGGMVRLSELSRPGEGGSWVLFAQYPDLAVWKDLNHFRFTTLSADSVTIGGTTIGGVEHITATGGGAAVNPTMSVSVTFVTTSGASGDAIGTLGSGPADGFEKKIIVESYARPYVLTVTAMCDSMGSAGTKTLTFSARGQSASLTWSASTASWYISNTGVSIA